MRQSSETCGLLFPLKISLVEIQKVEPNRDHFDDYPEVKATKGLIAIRSQSVSQSVVIVRDPRCFCYRYLGVEPRLTSGSIQGSSGIDSQTQIAGAGVIGPASAEKNCKNAHLTAKQQAICSRSPPVLQVFTSWQAGGPRSASFSFSPCRINARRGTRLIRFAGPTTACRVERIDLRQRGGGGEGPSFAREIFWQSQQILTKLFKST